MERVTEAVIIRNNVSNEIISRSINMEECEVCGNYVDP